MRTCHLPRMVIAALLIALSGQVGLGQTYRVVDLGKLGGASSSAFGLNKKGQVVGASETGLTYMRDNTGGIPSPIVHSFLWDAATGMNDLGTLGGIAETDFDVGVAINSSGQIAGWSFGLFSYEIPDDFGTFTRDLRATHAFLWTQGATDGVSSNPQMRDIGPVLPGYYMHLGNTIAETSQAAGLNDAGQVAVRSYGGGGRDQGFVYFAGTQHLLGYPAGGVASGLASLVINAKGWLALDYVIHDPAYPFNSGFYQTGFILKAVDTDADGIADLWNRDDNNDGINDLLIPLGTFGGTASNAYGMNDACEIVGDAETADGRFIASIWRDANGNGQTDPGDLMPLGTLPGDVGSWAQSINNSGQIIGGSYSDTATRWFIYDSLNGMRDLSALLSAGSGWTISEVKAINDNGEIVGSGIIEGETRAFLLKPITNAGPADDTVTVTPPSSTGLSLTFGTVNTPGTVTVTTSSAAPALPEGFQVSGTFIDIQTTATFSGGVELTVPYDPNVFPYYPDGATEAERWPGGTPRLMHYNSTLARWQNITTGVNPQNHFVTGVTTSFSPFAIVKAVPVSYGVNVLYDQEKVKKLGSTIPLKIELTAGGANVSSADRIVSALEWVHINGNATGVPEDSGNSNPDSNFRYDSELGGYIFNFSTAGLPGAGTYEVRFRAGADPTIKAIRFKVK